MLAADVFAYLPDLAPVAQAVAKVLELGGLFAFTLESHGGEGVELTETLRYSHGASHVRIALENAKFILLSLDSASTRTEKGSPVPGLVVVAEKK